MGLDVWFREDVARIMAAVAIARDGLTSDERTLLAALCAGFGISLAEVLTTPQGGCALPMGPRAVDAFPEGRLSLGTALPRSDVGTLGVDPLGSAQPPFGVVMQLPAAEERGSARRFTRRP